MKKTAKKGKSVLTDRQEEVANEILDGISPSNMSNYMKVPKVAGYIENKRTELSDALQIKRADVIVGMQGAIDMARLAADPMAMIRGWSEIAKLLGLYAPEVKKVELSVGGRNMISKYEAMSDEDLVAIIEGRTIDGDYERLQ